MWSGVVDNVHLIRFVALQHIEDWVSLFTFSWKWESLPDECPSPTFPLEDENSLSFRNIVMCSKCQPSLSWGTIIRTLQRLLNIFHVHVLSTFYSKVISEVPASMGQKERRRMERKKERRKKKYQQWLLESTNVTDSEVNTQFVSAKALKKLLGEGGEIIKVKLSLNMPWAVWWKCRYGSTHFLTLALDGVVVNFMPRHIPPWENCQHPLKRRLTLLQSQFGWLGKANSDVLPVHGIKPNNLIQYSQIVWNSNFSFISQNDRNSLSLMKPLTWTSLCVAYSLFLRLFNIAIKWQRLCSIQWDGINYEWWIGEHFKEVVMTYCRVHSQNVYGGLKKTKHLSQYWEIWLWLEFYTSHVQVWNVTAALTWLFPKVRHF